MSFPWPCGPPRMDEIGQVAGTTGAGMSGLHRRLTRRQVVWGVGAAGLALAAGCGAWPGQPGAQVPRRHYRLGYLTVGSRSGPVEVRDAFFERLREHGYVEGENLTIELRDAAFDYGRLPELAAELARLPVDVMLATGSLAWLAAARVTSTVPIVTLGGDPVRDGVAASYARPGGNLTGISSLDSRLGAKRLQLLKEAVPTASRIAVLWNASSPSKVAEVQETRAAAQLLEVELIAVEVHDREGFEGAFALAQREGADAMMVLPDVLTTTLARDLASLAARYHLPNMQERRDSVLGGGLMSYSSRFVVDYRRAADYVDRIFQGANPADLPIEEPREFEFAINLRTAHALGLTIPQSVLLQATEVSQ